ncbi:F-type H+-transporting ATPase subunit b [Bartonella sp. CDC_skunk]|uniref:ATP synthase subunit b n=1 Tax=Bartonella rochalimae ATCC BAA-1498 TaxID=685782 RepID=E6YMU7_9HYPH|nr:MULTISPECIES: F0F1 ATP synthase subunit B [Bartonella]AQX20992.1 F-type H+-transporting ATPase subunit b [Bartonella sp. CDC_skunk]AQX26250.1 F-type H+-transporting ATPase subunit b [Bartonella sp. Raccoon60]KEC56254.1 ATP synthase subunit B 2 [Bartonella rochalimae ATCC BAA-1498]CBI78185.1 ATP synthase subunit b 2 [Bartonella rochalimae ATCC BAA-1498]
MTDTFWAFIGLVLFLALLVYFEVPNAIIRKLDTRAKHIKDELDEALRLREEAQKVLAEYQRKHLEIEKETQEIIADAKDKVEAMLSETRIKTEEYIKNHSRLVEQKIAQAEANAIRTLSSTAVDLAISAINRLLMKELDAEQANSLIKEPLVKESLKKIETYFN